MTFLMIECQSCGQYFSINPIESKLQEIKDEKTSPLRCPVSRCCGWVSHIGRDKSEKGFWGCGECGSVWRSRAALFNEIREITKKYPYRASSYVLTDNDITPASFGNESEDYEELVGSEDKDAASSFQRD